MERGNLSWKARWKVMVSPGARGFGYGVVLRVAVVGSGEVEGGGEVALAVGFDVGDFYGA